MKLQSGFAKIGKRVGMVIAFGALYFVAAAPSAQAEERNAFQVRIEAGYRPNDAFRDHGYYNREVNDRRREMDRERERRWNEARYRRDRDDRWQNDRDRDRNDRNFNRDRDDHASDRDDGNRNRDHYNRDSR